MGTFDELIQTETLEDNAFSLVSTHVGFCPIETIATANLVLSAKCKTTQSLAGKQ